MPITLVSSVAVGSGGASSIAFTSIPQTGLDLLLLISGRHASSTSEAANIYFNSDNSSANYSRRFLEGYATSISSTSGTSLANILVNGSSQTSNTHGSTSFYITNYKNNATKVFGVDAISETNGTDCAIRMIAGRWSGTAAITDVTLTPQSGNFAQHSIASLYIIS